MDTLIIIGMTAVLISQRRQKSERQAVHVEQIQFLSIQFSSVQSLSRV